MLILAGDIGGTSSRLAFYKVVGGELEAVAEKHYPSRHYGNLIEIVKQFAEEHDVPPDRACFGIAGPVRAGKVETPNLPWSVDAESIAGLLGLSSVTFINDLDANAYGIAALQDGDLEVLNQGVPDLSGTIAVISAGTGLGESLAYWDGTCHRPLPSEAGHADFAPRSGLETELLQYLQAEFGRVSYERIVSGPGLCNIYRFFRDVHKLPEAPAVVDAMRTVDPARAITSAARTGSCVICSKSLELFLNVYGAEAGNAALRFFATGGVFVGGGIAPQIIDMLRGSGFMAAFRAKGRLSPMMATIPVKVILNDRTALLGAGRCASMQQR